MIILCIDFTDHCRAPNSVASQSSSSGCEGEPARVPKSLGVRTRPEPKWYCQIRLTITRANKGFSALANHSANALRRPVDLACKGGSGTSPPPNADGKPGLTSSPGALGLPRTAM